MPADTRGGWSLTGWPVRLLACFIYPAQNISLAYHLPFE
jgi:hypothetical protein